MNCSDLAVSFPALGVIRLSSQSLFGDVDHPTLRRFVERVLEAQEISEIAVTPGQRPYADLLYCPKRWSLPGVVGRVASLLRHAHENHLPSNHYPGCNGHAATNPGLTAKGHPGSNGNSHAGFNGLANSVEGSEKAKPNTTGSRSVTRTREGVVRYTRSDAARPGWRILQDRPGRLQLEEPGPLPQERPLPGDRARADERAGGREVQDRLDLAARSQVDYDPRQLTRDQVIEILDSALANAEHPTKLDKLDLHLPICTASLPLAAAAQFAFPPLLPVAAAVFAYTSIPTFKEARARPLRGEAAGGRRARRHRGRRLPRHDGDLPGRRALLVPQLRPSAGEADAGQFQEAPAERLRQAAAVRLAATATAPRCRSRSTSSRRATSSS